MTMITPSYLGETIEYSSLHACRSTLEDPTPVPREGTSRLPTSSSACRPSKIVDVFRATSATEPRLAETLEAWRGPPMPRHSAILNHKILLPLGEMSYTR